MGNRLSKIYTKTGDDGTTGLGDGTRVAKDHARVEAYGTVDEANSTIGMILAVPHLPADIHECLTGVQHDLFDLGGELCIPGMRLIEAQHTERLEEKLDAFNEPLPPLKDFILPGGGPADLASSVAAPLERRLGAIPGVTEMSSSSGNGSVRINLQFELSKKIDTAAREVQAAINAARVDLPTSLRSNPTYSKSNSTDSPVIVLALTSKTRSTGQIYEAVSNQLQQRLMQVEGVGDVELGGGSLPAVRIELLPFALHRQGLSAEDVRAAIQSATANRPKGMIDGDGRSFQIITNTGATADRLNAENYQQLIVAWRNGAPVRLSDVANVYTGSEDRNTLGLFNGVPAVVVMIYRQPTANVIETVDAVRALVPALKEELPPDIELKISSDSTNSIRSSLREIELTLVISIILVILVVSAFLRSARATLIPAVATIVSLLGTFSVMYLLGFSLNNISLMALTIATGFVVDDAIVVLENITRHREMASNVSVQANPSLEAALHGAREVSFTVVSISISLVAVFIPLLFMGGQVGRLFREFALTLSAAVLISLLISLTTTPMMCAWLLRQPQEQKPPGPVSRFFARAYASIQHAYAQVLDIALDHRWLVLTLLAAVIALNAWLFMIVPKGFFPQQDATQITAGLRADQSISFEAMKSKVRQMVEIIRKDPAVATVTGYTGGSRPGGGFMFITLKPRAERKESGQEVIGRLRPQLSRVTGVSAFMVPVQDLRVGGRRDVNQIQYTLKSDNLDDLKLWTGKLVEAMKRQRGVVDVDSDLQENGVETFVRVDRDAATRLGISSRDINNALYNAFGQRQVATLYGELNQYRVIMEHNPAYTRSPQALNDIYVPVRAAAGSVSANPALRDVASGQSLSTASTVMVPLSNVASFAERSTAASVSHQDAELAGTVSFNLGPGLTLPEGQAALRSAVDSIAIPASVRGSFQGTARAYQESQGQQPLLILAALVVIYIVLGILYESLLHPLTVLSTIPSAGIGAVVALMLFGMEFSLIALIGLFLLIGIVKKNAILIIDFALQAERNRGLSPREAVREACLHRLRPILMTTAAAALGALPLAIGFGEGSELRQPLGVAIIGGLVASQLLTLLTTPVVYLTVDRWRHRSPNERALGRDASDASDTSKPDNTGNAANSNPLPT
ncbi:MAG: cob(I)yrinic acid a,c-diamide adenosyltransferase [Burkholderiaceae bacterium]|nr:cob(I)yrinic acid a,c-diamide adenosyltransferase [Burkholderiaceae bacterium]